MYKFTHIKIPQFHTDLDLLQLQLYTIGLMRIKFKFDLGYINSLKIKFLLINGNEGQNNV